MKNEYGVTTITRLKMTRGVKRLCWIIFILLFIIFLLELYPQIFFKYKTRYLNFIIYSHVPLNKEIYPILNDAETHIRRSELYYSYLKQRIFMCNSYTEFTILCPSQRFSFACNDPINENIILCPSNIALNKIERNGKENNIRTLSGTISHETTHTLVRTYLGLLRYLFVGKWKNEGYCDYIADESSYPFDKGMKEFCLHQIDKSPSFEYFKFRLYIKFLIENRKLSIKKILGMNFNISTLDNDTRNFICKKNANNSIN